MNSSNQHMLSECRERLAGHLLADVLHEFVKSELKGRNVPEMVITHTVTDLMIEIAADMGKQYGMEQWADQFADTISTRIKIKLPDKITSK